MSLTVTSSAPAPGANSPFSISALLADANGRPMSGQAVDFKVFGAGSAHLSADRALTGASGMATVDVTNTGPGPLRVTATANDYQAHDNIVVRPPATGLSTTNAHVSGTLGTNGWYRDGAPVQLTLAATTVATDPGVITVYSINGGPVTVYTAPVTFTDGSYAVTYFSTNQAGGSEAATTIFVNVDSSAPLTQGIQATAITSVSATIAWTTNEPADSSVDYGPTTLYGTSTTPQKTLVTSQSVHITGLQSDTLYHVRVHGADVAGNPTTAPDFAFRTAAATSKPPLTPSSSIKLDGSTGYAEAADARDLNLTGDWTVEAWFKDEDPSGFNHDYVNLLNKGDRATNAEAPYFLSLGYKRLVAGLRFNWTDQTIAYDLYAGRIEPENVAPRCRFICGQNAHADPVSRWARGRAWSTGLA